MNVTLKPLPPVNTSDAGKVVDGTYTYANPLKLIGYIMLSGDGNGIPFGPSLRIWLPLLSCNTAVDPPLAGRANLPSCT